jgi:hypothetical protein
VPTSDRRRVGGGGVVARLGRRRPHPETPPVRPGWHPHYWIVDQRQRTLTVLRHDKQTGYEEVAVVAPGTTWHTDVPYDLALDPADFV